PGRTGALHAQVVAEYESVKAEFLSQDSLEPDLGKAGRTRIDTRVHDVRGHNRRKSIANEPRERNQIGFAKRLKRAIVDRQLEMGVRPHMAVSGKMLSDGSSSTVAQPEHECRAELCHGFDVTVERPIADDAAIAMIDIQDGRKAQVDAVCAQLGGENETEIAREVACVLRAAVPRIPERTHGGQPRESRPKTLHPTPFMI